MAASLKDARVAVHVSHQSLNTRSEVQRQGADTPLSADPQLCMLQFEEAYIGPNSLASTVTVAKSRIVFACFRDLP